MSRYVRSSTLHGFQYAVMDTSSVKRLLWSILMLIGSLLFIFKLNEGNFGGNLCMYVGNILTACLIGVTKLAPKERAQKNRLHALPALARHNKGAPH